MRFQVLISICGGSRGRVGAYAVQIRQPAQRGGRRSTTAPAPGGRGWFGSAGAIRRPGSSGCGTWRSSSSHAGTRSVPTGVHANVLAGVPLAVPQPDRAGSAVPQAFATHGDQRRCRPDRNPGDAGGRLAGSWHERSAPPFTRAFTSPSPEPAPDAGTVTCSFTSPSPDAGWLADGSRRRSPRRPPSRAAGRPRRWPFTPSSPRPSSRRPRRRRARGGRRWWA